MSAPDHRHIVKAVYDAGHYDLTTKIGCGRFIEDSTFALQQHDRNWGHLLKPPGRNQWNGHAVDNALYLSGTPGQSQAVDMVVGAEGSSAKLGWAPDQPRYSASDWYAPTAGDTFVLPAHGCLLGASLFWFFGAWRRSGEVGFQDRIDRNLDALTTGLTADYVRTFATVGGRVDSRTGLDPWGRIGTFYAWSEWKDLIASGTEYLRQKFNLLSAPTLVGEGAQFRNEDHILEMVEDFCAVVKPLQSMLLFVEMWNERFLTGGYDSIVRKMGARFHELLPSMAFALDTPALAMGGLEEGQLQPLWDEVTRLYGGTAATVITPQWNRAEPNPLDCGPTARHLSHIAHEPRGPGASAGGDVHDPLPLVHDYIQAAIADQIHNAGPVRYGGYTFHAAPLVWFGECVGYPGENRYPNVYDLPTWPAITRSLAAVRAGKLPDAGGGEPEMPLKPREQFAAEYADVNAFYAAEVGLKRPGGMVIDSAKPVEADVTAMTQWGYDLVAGATPTQVKHAICQSEEWKSKHPGETPPF